MENSGLASATGLLRQSFDMTKNKAKVLYGITGLNYVIWIVFGLVVGVSVLGLGAVAGAKGMITGGILGTIVLVILIIISLRLQIAMVEAIINNYDFKQSFGSSKGKITPFFWTAFLTGIIVALGCLLLIIPGIIFAVWYAFSSLIVLAEGLSGMKALHQSKSYVSGRWGAVAWRLVVIGVVTWLISVGTQVIFILLLGKNVAGILNLVVTFILVPFAQVYAYLLYKSLKETTVVVAPVAVTPSMPGNSSVQN